MVSGFEVEQTKRYTFDHSEAKGIVTVRQSTYGVEFDVEANGHKFTGLIDLFYFTQNFIDDPEKGNCLQIAVDLPTTDDDGVAQMWVSPDGKVGHDK